MNFSAMLVEKSNTVIEGKEFLVASFVEYNNGIPTTLSRKWYVLSNDINKEKFATLKVGEEYTLALNFLGKIASVI